MSESDAHIQDADILKMSTQQQHESKPLIRFACTLPSGRELHSEWLDPGKRREAVQAWLTAVRAEIVADETEARLQARKKALEERAKQDTSRESAPSVATQSPSKVADGSSTIVAPPPRSVTSALSSDPNVFVGQAVTQAEQNVAYWRAEASKATALWQEAELQLKKWRAIALSVGVPTDASVEANSPNRAAAVQSATESVAIRTSDVTGHSGAFSDTSHVCEI